MQVKEEVQFLERLFELAALAAPPLAISHPYEPHLGFGQFLLALDIGINYFLRLRTSAGAEVHPDVYYATSVFHEQEVSFTVDQECRWSDVVLGFEDANRF